MNDFRQKEIQWQVDDIKQNQVLWKGAPSHWVNMHVYAAYVAIVAMLLLFKNEFTPIVSALVGSEDIGGAYGLVIVAATLPVLWRILENYFHSYEITEQVFRERYGVLNRHVDELELYRVSDSSTYAPLYLRLFGLGVVNIHTTDRTSSLAQIKGVTEAENIRGMVRNQAEAMRRKRGIVEIGNLG